MGSDFRRISRFIILAMIISCLSLSIGMVSRATATTRTAGINAFFLDSEPAKQDRLENLFHTLKRQGANTVVLRTPLKEDALDRDLLAKEVFLAHQTGLKIFLILSTRENKTILQSHREWEDLKFDAERDLLLPDGKLDLFEPRAVEALAAFAAKIASYPVDGIFLAEDFSYAENEGLSNSALMAYHRKGGSLFALKRVFSKLDGKSTDLGESFWIWTKLKRNILLTVYRSLVKAIWSVNASSKVGIPLHGEGLLSSRELLASNAYDIELFDRMNPDYYWLAANHRKRRASEGLSYDRRMETLARTAKGAAQITSAPGKIIIAIETTDRQGKLLPYSEIEDAARMIVAAQGPSVAFMVSADNQLPPVLTKKIFRWNHTRDVVPHSTRK